MISGWIIGVIAVAMISNRIGIVDQRIGIPWHKGFPVALALSGSALYALVQIGTLAGLP